ncbi:hypothetical protein GCM10027570_32110 [Streptomonospora sediminis]
MAKHAHFFIKTNTGIGQIALELAYAFQQGMCKVMSDGTLFTIAFTDMAGRYVEAYINLMYTDFREHGDPGPTRGTAVEYFDYEIEAEFGTKTMRAHRDETDAIGRLLYDQLVRRSRHRRPMAYALEGTDIAALTFPGGRTLTVSPAVPSESPEMRDALAVPEVQDFHEEPVALLQDNSGVCHIRFDGESIKILPLVNNATRDPVAPGVIINSPEDPISEGPQIVGEALAYSIEHSAAATTGEVEIYPPSTEDLIDMSGSDRLLEARTQQGRLTLTWAPPQGSPVGTPVYDGPPPDTHVGLGTLIENTLAL